MRKVLYAALGAFIGSLLFAVQVRAQTPAQLPIMCGEYKQLAESLTRMRSTPTRSICWTGATPILSRAAHCSTRCAPSCRA